LAPLYDSHEFWETQPVPRASETVDESKIDRPIDKEKTVDDVDANPLPLPEGFYWSEVDLTDEK